MKSYNRVIFKGVLGNDARVNQTGDGRRVANISVATEYGVRQKDGTWRDETTWLNVVAWEGFGICPAASLVKGAKVCGAGRLRVRAYNDKEGNRREVTEVVADSLDIVADIPKSPSQKTAQNQSESPRGIETHADDDLPF